MTIPDGLCQCGCGQKTKVAPHTHKRRGWIKGKPLRFLHNHHCKEANNANWKGGRKKGGRKGTYWLLKKEGHPRAHSGGYVYEHILLAEKALGKILPSRVEIHHVNENGADNRNQNLVVCENDGYHKILHARDRALKACGHAHWRECRFCHKWEEPENINTVKSGAYSYHPKCNAEAQQKIRKEGK